MLNAFLAEFIARHWECARKHDLPCSCMELAGTQKEVNMCEKITVFCYVETTSVEGTATIHMFPTGLWWTKVAFNLITSPWFWDPALPKERSLIHHDSSICFSKTSYTKMFKPPSLAVRNLPENGHRRKWSNISWKIIHSPGKVATQKKWQSFPQPQQGNMLDKCL